MGQDKISIFDMISVGELIINIYTFFVSRNILGWGQFVCTTDLTLTFNLSRDFGPREKLFKL